MSATGDIQPITSTYPLVRAAAWNALCNHGLEATASYVIRQNVSYFEALKGGTNTNAKTIAFGGASDAGSTSGVDANAVIQAALDHGTKILLKDGTYTNIALEPNAFNQLIGESWSTILKSPASPTAEVIEIDTADGIVLRNFQIDGNMAAQPAGTHKECIYFKTSNHNLVDHIYVSNAKQLGCRTSTTSSDTLIKNCRFDTGEHQGVNIAGTNNRVFNSFFKDFNERAIVLADANYCKANYNYIDQHIGTGEGLQISYCGAHITAKGNTIVGCNGGQSIVLEAKAGGATTELIYINIFDNTIAETGAGIGGIQLSCDVGHSLARVNISKNHIIVPGESVMWIDHNNGLITYVHFRENDYDGIINYATLDSGIGVFQFGDNIGEKLVASNSTSGTGAQQTIAHSLNQNGTGIIPTRVFLSDWDSGANAYQSAAADATNIYVTAVNGKGYYWKAEFVT